MPVRRVYSDYVASEKPVYERRFSVFQRVLRVLVSPPAAMQDIVEVPEYVGGIVVLVLRVVVAFVGLWLMMQKIVLVGSSSDAERVWPVISIGVTVGMVLAGFLLMGFWAVKSWLATYLCRGSGAWSFDVAAAVVGYAYLPDLLLSVFGTVVSYFVVPSFSLKVSQEGWLNWLSVVGEITIEQNVLRRVYGLPFLLFGVCWKSYLCALGAHFGTRKGCSVRMAFVVFFLLGLAVLLFGVLSRSSVIIL